MGSYSFGHLFLSKHKDIIKSHIKDNCRIADNNEKWFYYLENNNLLPNKSLSNYCPFIFFDFCETYNRKVSIFSKGKKILSLDFSEGHFSVPSTIIELIIESGEISLNDDLFEAFREKAIHKIENSARVKESKRELFSFDFDKLKIFDLDDDEINNIRETLSFVNFRKLYIDAPDKTDLFNQFFNLMQIKHFDITSYNNALGIKRNIRIL